MEYVKQVVDIELNKAEMITLCEATALLENMVEKFERIYICEINKDKNDAINAALSSMYTLCAHFSCRTNLGIDEYNEVYTLTEAKEEDKND